MAEKLGIRLRGQSQSLMRYYLFILLLAAAVIVGSCCEQQKMRKKPQAHSQSESVWEQVTQDEAPLLLEDEPLLLLDDEPEALSSDEPGADNSRCFVCHVNYMQEDIAVTHARADMGCATCHGESDEHIADESWASGGNGTAPDIMYPLSKINPFCMSCHTKDKIDTEQHKPLFAAGAMQMVCTDCHGDHRLTNRKCKWK
ncbi:multiheme c-type cytochrome [Planctomycetota bacterium]